MSVEIVQRGAGKKFSTGKIKKIALTILELVAEKNAELSLALIGNVEMRKLNAKYRKKHYATDVLSFPTLLFPSKKPPNKRRLAATALSRN
jgi:ssRNA-specific RNase YbeY (16S rRNA maturation enzyme)